MSPSDNKTFLLYWDCATWRSSGHVDSSEKVLDYNMDIESSLICEKNDIYLKQCKISLTRYGWQPIGGADATARMIRQGNENVHTDYPVDVASWYFCFLGMPFGTQLPTSRPSSGRK